MKLCECGCGKEVTPGSRWRKGHHHQKYPFGLGRRSAEYQAYENAKNRCEDPQDPSYKNYGGRGIQFRFASYWEFLSFLGPRPKGWRGKRPLYSLDRIDNDGHYEPGNVRWATRSQQNKNRRWQPGDLWRKDDRPKWLVLLERDRKARERY